MLGLWKRNVKVCQQDPYVTDAEMSAARILARGQWSQFQRAFENRIKDGATDFCVRVPLVKGNITERMWLAVVGIHDGLIEGALSSNPTFRKDLRIGQRVQVNASEVEDWMYHVGENQYGGYSVIVLLGREIQQLNGLPSNGNESREAAEHRVCRKWASLLERQLRSQDARIALRRDDEATLGCISQINALLCGNLNDYPREEELADKVRLPVSAVQIIFLLSKLMDDVLMRTGAA